MSGARSLLPALVAVAATLIGGAGVVPVGPAAAQAAPTARAPAVEPDPLAVTIESLNPSVIPEEGKVTITGTVTNTSDETWYGVNVYPLTSSTLPMTSRAELDAAAVNPADSVIGERITEVSDQLADLDPGEVQPYAVRVPRRYLGRTEGVYWLGVHALAESSAGRDDIADGKARTFIPLVEGRKSLETSVVLQLRRRLQYAADGRLEQPDRWAADLAPGGRLRSIVELGATAGDLPVTWLMDPAVVAAVLALEAGNVSRMPPAPVLTEEGEEATPTPTPTEATDPTDPPGSPPAGTGDAASDPADPTAVAAASTEATVWLSRLQAALAGKELLALPYGDVDASAASRLQPDLLAAAQGSSAAIMSTLGLANTPALGSPNGFLSPTAVQGAAPETTVLASSAAVAAVDTPTVVDVDGHAVVLSSATAVQGGPGPDDPLAPVAVRQRILSEAAVRLLTPGREPLVVTVPIGWNPTDTTGFFAGLDVDFVDLVPLSQVAAREADPVAAEDYLYPPFQSDFELDAPTFGAADALIRAGTTLQQVLTATTTLGEAVSREAYADTSYWQRTDPTLSRAAAARSRSWITGMLGRVTVTGPRSVTLSSATGQFPATVVNGLDEPVLVQVGASSSSAVDVEVPDPVELDPGESTRLRLSATTTQVGTHTIRLYVASSDGTPLGDGTELPIRSGQVSRIIWIVMLVGGGLLFGAIAVRLVRRVRTARREGAA